MQEIIKQTSWVFFAQIITRIIGFFYTIYLANTLGISNFGLFSVGLAYFSIISSLSDFGFNRFLIREVAKDNTKLWDLLWNILILRLCLISALFGIFAVSLYFFDQDKTRVSIILLSTLAVLPQTAALTIEGVFIALRKLKFSAIAAFISSISTVFMGFILVERGFGVIGAVNALILGQVVYVLSFITFLYLSERFTLSEVKTKTIAAAIKGSLPYGALALLGLLYFKIDTIMLSYMRGSFETGIYSAGYKFLESLIFIPNALSLVLFPTFAKLHESNPLKIKGLILKSTGAMFLLGLAIGVGYFFILPEIIKLLLPNYLQAIDVIKILSLTIPLIFVYVSATQVLISSEKYLKQIILVSLIPLFFNIILNLIFIPSFGIYAAAWTTVLSDFISTSIILFLIYRYFLKNG